MRGTIVCFCLLLLIPAFLQAKEPVPQAAFDLEEVLGARPVSKAQAVQSLSSSENWCGAPCSLNGTLDECIGYNACGWLQIDACQCFRGRWSCVWTC